MRAKKQPTRKELEQEVLKRARLYWKETSREIDNALNYQPGDITTFTAVDKRLWRALAALAEFPG